MRVPRPRLTLLPAFIAVSLSSFGGISCKKEKETASVLTIPAESSLLPALDRKQEEQIGMFARQFAADVRAAKVSKVMRFFQNEMLLQRSLSGVTMDSTSYDNFKKGALAGMVNESGGALGAIIGGNFAYLRVLTRDGEPQLLFRLASTTGFDYYRFRFDFGGADESPRLYDFYSYTTGEYASQSMRRAIIPLIVEMGGSLGEGESLKPSDKLILDNMERVQAVAKHKENGESYLALKELRSLPGPVQKQRFARGIELQVLSEIPEKEREYVAALEKMETDFPNDPSMMMVMLDYYILKKDSEKVRALLNAIEMEVGLDPYHEILRGMLFLADKDYENAQKSAWSAISAGHSYELFPNPNPSDQSLDKTSQEAWYIVLEAGLKSKNHRTVASALATIHSKFGIELGETAFDSPLYAEFFLSPEGKALKSILEGGDPDEALKGLHIIE